MQQQASLEARFEELLGARDALKAMNNKEPYIANQAELRRVASELRATTNRLRSNLQENPDVSDNLAHAHTTRARLMSLVGDLINEIDAEGTWTTLDEMLEEERREGEAREEAFAREREVTAKVKALRTQLVEEKEAHVAYTTEKARLMEGYKEELKEKKGATGLRLRFIRKDLEANSERLSREQMQELNRLQREIDETQAKIDTEKEVNAETMAYLEKRNAELLERVAALEVKHREKKEQKQKELSEIKTAREELLVELAEWEEKYKTKLREHEADVEERRKWEESALRRSIDAEIHARAAANLRMLYGGWKAERDEKLAAKAAAAEEKAKGKKGKGGKGKGKGK